jgi:hypothetical protein
MSSTLKAASGGFPGRISCSDIFAVRGEIDMPTSSNMKWEKASETGSSLPPARPKVGGHRGPDRQKRERSRLPAFVASKAAVFVLDEPGYVGPRQPEGFKTIAQHSVPNSQEP